MSDTIYIVCAAADMPSVVPGSIFTHKCALCGRGLMLAPTGQKYLAAHPQAKLVCLQCAPADAFDQPMKLVGTFAEVRAEMKTMRPNLRRHRN